MEIDFALFTDFQDLTRFVPREISYGTFGLVMFKKNMRCNIFGYKKVQL